MKTWESGMAVCEIGGAADPRAHFHGAEPLGCAACDEFACDFHGDRSIEDDEWLCIDCAKAEQERHLGDRVRIESGDYQGSTGSYEGVDEADGAHRVKIDGGVPVPADRVVVLESE